MNSELGIIMELNPTYTRKPHQQFKNGIYDIQSIPDEETGSYVNLMNNLVVDECIF